MKKLYLLLIFVFSAQLSYASFPISGLLDIASSDPAILYDSSSNFIYTLLGFLVGLFSVLLFFLPLFLLFSPNHYFRRGIYMGLITLLLIAVGFSIYGGAGLVIM